MFAHPLARHIAAILALKCVALVALYLAFFAPVHRPAADSAAVAAAILSAHPTDASKVEP